MTNHICRDSGIEIKGNDGWVSVKDRLPSFEVEVLVYDNAIYIGRLTDYSFVDDENPYQWSIHFGRINPTHWMPLPSPPESE